MVAQVPAQWSPTLAPLQSPAAATHNLNQQPRPRNILFSVILMFCFLFILSGWMIGGEHLCLLISLSLHLCKTTFTPLIPSSCLVNLEQIFLKSDQIF